MQKRKKNPFIKKEDDQWVITEKGYKKLDDLVTNSTGNVYAFTKKADPLLVGASMARLSRRDSGLRETYLDEFTLDEADAGDLIKRVVTAYGDDSVQQLSGIHFVVEDASNLLTKKLEWGRFMSYLEQSTRYIFFDKKDSNGKFKYFIPTNLKGSLRKDYIKIMDQIFTLYSQLVRDLANYVREKSGEPKDKLERTAWMGATRAQACDAIRTVLPVATKSTVGFFGSAQATESLILHLLSENLLEHRSTGISILKETRKVIPAFLERTDHPERGMAMVYYRINTRENLQGIVKDLNHKSLDSKEVSLVDYWPKNEMDLIPEMLYSETNLPLNELRKKTDKLSKKKQEEIFKAYMGKRLNRRHKPGRAMEKPHYQWEITADYGTFRDLQRHRVVDQFEWQNLTVDYGYEVPNLVKEAGMEKIFRKCFSLSEKLYQKMIKGRFKEEAQYATLFGHKMRYRFILNARASFHFMELRTSPQGHPGYRRIVNEMHRQLSKVHKRIGSAMIFVNKKDDPTLTRMAGEMLTLQKLKKLGGK